jgi:putative ABC transport system permease protein
MSFLVMDVRHALRLLRRAPAFAACAVGTLALGIGAATAVFSLVQTTLLHDLPYTHPDRLVWMYNARTERDRAPFSIPDLNDYMRDARTLAGTAAFTNWTADLTGAGDAERLEGTRVSGQFFELLGSAPALGRVFTARDETEGARVAVLTHGLWMRRFGGDLAIAGQAVVLNGAPYTIVGVLPAGFLFPFRDAEIAVPLALRDDPRRGNRGANFLRVVARLAPGVTIAQATADLDTTARRLQRQFPEDDARKTGVNLYPLQSEIMSDYRPILWTLFAAVGVLIAIGSGNLANLLLVRAVGRQPELALRASLGASRGAIVRQLLTEALVLSALGGAGGVLLAQGAIAAWRGLGPATFPLRSEVAIDGRVLAFAAVVSIAVACAAGLVPAWLAARDVAAGLVSATRATTGHRRHGRVRRAFVAIQVAGAAVLLVCMGLVARGFARLERVDPGFSPEHALSVQVSLPPARYASAAAISAFYDALALRLASISGVRAAGAVSLLPLSGLLNTMDVAFPGQLPPRPDAVPQAHFRVASSGYFPAAGIRVLAGREFSGRDTEKVAPVAIVSRAFAARHWPGVSAVGQHVTIDAASPPPVLEVVGVVSDVKQFTLDGAPTADLYIPIHQVPASQASLLTARLYWVLRTDGEPRLLEAQLRAAVHEVDRDVAASSVRTLDEVVATSLAARRANVRLLEVFGEVAMILAAVGAYAVAAFSAGVRRRELAIRVAFGASRRDLARLMLRDELQPVLAGLGAGLLCALVAGRWLDGVLFAVSPSDPATYLLTAVGLLAVTVIATYVPARRAGVVDPAELLRG